MLKRRSILVATALLSVELGYGQAEEKSDAIELDGVVVTASPIVTSKEELVVPASELAGEELRRTAQSSLGATLEGEPGVHSTYYGPGAGRPVIRGFDGDRIRILNQGTDSFDVSQTSPDHGVSIEPLFADDIEVIRGPASLLYGNAAIGGVVNVIGKELPSERAVRPVSGQVEAFYGTVAEEQSVGIALQGGQGDFAWSVGFLDRESSDIDIPGYAESVYQMEAEEEEHEDEDDDHGDEDDDHDEDEGHDEHEDEEEAFGVLENSFVDTRSGYLGFGWFGENASLAVSYSEYATDYGVPGHSHAHGEEHHDDEGDDHGEGEDHDEDEGDEHDEDEHHDEEEELVSIDLDQSRFTLRGELLQPFEFLESLELDLTFGDYTHQELEGDEVGTVFDREGYELRLVGVHSPVGKLTGAFGFQAKVDDFSAVGEEAFIPSAETSQYGVFVMERLNQEWGALEFGARIEQVDIDTVDITIGDRSFDTVNGSVGFVNRLSESSVLSANLVYAERAPNTSELFAFGPHIGTQSFEIGDASLDKESSTSLDVSYRLVAGKLTGEVSVFFSDFSDYVYLQFLDEDTVSDLYSDLDTDELSVYQATAVDAEFYGFEIDLRYHIIDEADRAMHLDFLYDQTRATNESFGTNLPRIPTRRLGVRYEYMFGSWLVGVESRWHDEASNLGPNQLPTDSYVLWGADLRYRMYVSDTTTVDFFVVGTNLGDQEARANTSFLKDVAPMPGRNVKLGVRASF